MSRPEKLFGTDGVRGTANVHPMTAEVALSLGEAVAHVLRVPGGERRRIIIGKDTRLSGYMFEDALAAGICSMGVDVIQVGPMPTPGMAFLTTDMRCHAGVMISASHNPYQDNGIKFFSSDGFKLPDADRGAHRELDRGSGALSELRAAPRRRSVRARRIDDAEGRYVVFLKNTFPRDLTARRPARGARLRPRRGLQGGPDGAVASSAPRSSAGRGTRTDATSTRAAARCIPSGSRRKVREVRADVGIALDGDADRCVIVDERGEVVDGDALLALFAHRPAWIAGSCEGGRRGGHGDEQPRPREGARGCMGLADPHGVGDRYVVEAMRERGYNLGGEQSGHILFLDHNTTGDGLMSGAADPRDHATARAPALRAGRPASSASPRCW